MGKIFYLFVSLALILNGCKNRATEEAQNTPCQQEEEIDETHDYIDLGLPSGTLWATTNIGARLPEEPGDYFAWGETKPKQEYSWNTYKYSYRDNSKFFHENQMTKYCTNEKDGTVDNKTELEPTDDAAVVNWGSNWRIPSREQIKELSDKCEWKKTTLPGRKKVFRVTGPNGNVLILPCGGKFLGRGLIDIVGEASALYWSRTLNTYLDNSSAECITNGNVNLTSQRSLGLLVRAIYER